MNLKRGTWEIHSLSCGANTDLPSLPSACHQLCLFNSSVLSILIPLLTFVSLIPILAILHLQRPTFRCQDAGGICICPIDHLIMTLKRSRQEFDLVPHSHYWSIAESRLSHSPLQTGSLTCWKMKANASMQEQSCNKDVLSFRVLILTSVDIFLLVTRWNLGELLDFLYKRQCHSGWQLKACAEQKSKT